MVEEKDGEKMGLIKYILKRILQMIPTLLAIIIFNFFLIHIGGDPVYILAGDDATPEFMEAMRERYGLDKPLNEQLFTYLSLVCRGDLGRSWRWNEPVIKIITLRLSNTLLIVFSSQLLAITIGIILGVYSAKKYPSLIETVISSISLIMYSIPLFWFGLILLIVFGFYLRWFPSGGMMSIM